MGKKSTWRAKSGTGSQEGRPSWPPSEEHSSDMRTGLGAVALYTPENDLSCSAWMYMFTRSSLHSPYRLLKIFPVPLDSPQQNMAATQSVSRFAPASDTRAGTEPLAVLQASRTAKQTTEDAGKENFKVYGTDVKLVAHLCIQEHHCRPLPRGPPAKMLNTGSILPSAPPSRASTIPAHSGPLLVTHPPQNLSRTAVLHLLNTGAVHQLLCSLASAEAAHYHCLQCNALSQTGTRLAEEQHRCHERSRTWGLGNEAK